MQPSLTLVEPDAEGQAKTRGLETIVRAVAAGGTSAVSDDSMRWLFGSPDPALTFQQQFLQDFLADKPDRAANRARQAFCAAHGLKAKQDRGTGYWTFARSKG